MTTGMKFLIGSVNYIEKYKFTNEDVFYEKLLESPRITPCRDSNGAVTARLSEWQKHVKEYKKVDTSDSVDPIDSENNKLEELKKKVEELQSDYKNLFAEVSNIDEMTEGGKTINETKFIRFQAISSKVDNYISKVKDLISKVQTEKWNSFSDEVRALSFELNQILEKCKRMAFGIAEEMKRLNPKDELKDLLEKYDSEFARIYSTVEEAENMTEGTRDINDEKLKKYNSVSIELDSFVTDLKKVLEDVKANAYGGTPEKIEDAVEKIEILITNCGEIIKGIFVEISRLQKTALLVCLNDGFYKSFSDKVFITSEGIAESFSSCGGNAYARISLTEDKSFSFSENGLILAYSERKAEQNSVLKNGSEFIAGGKRYLLLGGEAAKAVHNEKKQLILRALKSGEPHALVSDALLLDRSHNSQWTGDILTDRHIHRSAHAKVFKRDEKWMVAHVNIPEEGKREPNPTFINGVEMEPPYGEGNARKLSENDVIRVYNEDFRIENLALRES